MKEIEKQSLKALKAARRKEEIEAHGKQISMRTTVEKSKRVYSRKRKHKAELE